MQGNLVRACTMNNAAVDLMEAGLFDPAQVVLAKSIQAAKNLIRQEENDDQRCAARNHNIEGPAETCSPSLEFLFQTSIISYHRPGGETTVANTSQANVVSSGDGAPFVYHRAFKFRCDHGIPQLETVCAIILYNMGIAFHLNRVTPSCSHQELKHAANIYLLTLRACHANSTPIATVPPVLRVAILNNLGEIYFRLCQYGAMESAYGDMQNLWCENTGPFLNQVERWGLLWNAQFVKKPNVAAAA